MPVLSGASSQTVIVFAPADCPSDAAQRAEAIMGQLASEGVAAARSSEANFDFDAPPDEVTIKRINAVMTEGEMPVVFVNGKAKGNPSLGEIVVEYRRGRAG